MVYVVMCAAAYAAVGVLTMVDPVGSLAAVGVTGDAAGVVELRAMYGGLELGMFAFLVWCIARGQLKAGVVAGTLSVGGLGVVRAIGWLAAGAPWSLHPLLFALELPGGLVGVFTWWTMVRAVRNPGETL